MKKRFWISLLFLTFSLHANASEMELDHEKIPSDHDSVLRGAEHVVNECTACHGLKYIKFTDMLTLGVPKETVDKWRSFNPVNSRILAEMSEQTAATAFGGVIPPDLSLMTIAREGGVHYLYSFLIAYSADPKGGPNPLNHIYPDTLMPDILGIATATDDKQRAEIKTKAKEITAFLNWAADPRAAERKQLGIYVIVYLSILTLLLYLWKAQIWRKLA